MPGVTITSAVGAPALSEGPGDAAGLPRMPGNGRFTRAEIDRRATGVAAAARYGVVSQAHARRVVAALLYGSSVPEAVAAGWNGTGQDRADIADRLRMLLFTKVMQETPGGFRTDVVAGGASVSGWATQLARAALRGAARDALLPQRERPLPPSAPARDGVGDPRGYRSITEVSDLVGSVPDIAEHAAASMDRVRKGDCSTMAAAEAGLTVLRGMRPASRRHRGAAHLRDILGLPAAPRPRDPVLRERIAAALDVDPEAARRAVRAELARRAVAVSRGAAVGDEVSALWTGYPKDDLVTLAGLDPRVAHAVAVAAVTPRPAIRADVAAALAAQIRRAEPDDPAWDGLATALVAAFLAHISDLPSEFSPAHRTAAPKAVRQKAREAEVFARMARRAAAFPEAPLGGVPAMVEAELHDRLLLIERIVADLGYRPAADGHPPPLRIHFGYNSG